MKNWKLFISGMFLTSAVFFSCATNSAKNVDETNKSINQESEIVESEPTAEELYLEKLENIKIQFTNTPRKIKKNQTFENGYEILVSKNDQPVSDFEISLTVPVKKDGSKLVFDTVKLTTDQNGIVVYEPEVPDFAAKTVVIASPYISSELNILPEQIEDKTVQADFLVESDVALKGSILFIFEYNENGKSPKNSYDILSGLRKKGVSMIGNAPISDTAYINASKEKIYKENFEYVGTDFGYLIGGTIKFTNPVEKNEDGTYTAHLVASMYGIEMKTGIVIYEDTIEYIGSGTNWNKAVEDCKEQLTAKVVDSIMFGL